LVYRTTHHPHEAAATEYRVYVPGPRRSHFWAQRFCAIQTGRASGVMNMRLGRTGWLNRRGLARTPGAIAVGAGLLLSAGASAGAAAAQRDSEDREQHSPGGWRRAA